MKENQAQQAIKRWINDDYSVNWDALSESDMGLAFIAGAQWMRAKCIETGVQVAAECARDSENECERITLDYVERIRALGGAQ